MYGSLSRRSNMMKHMTGLLLGFLSTIIVFCGNVTWAEPIKFNYGEIPFGKSINEVLSLVDGAEIQADSASIGFLRNYQGYLEKHFNRGFYTSSGLGAELLGSVTKGYRVSYQGWENLLWIDLYFMKDYGTKDRGYKLFMVIKAEKNATGTREDVFKRYAKSIADVLKTDATVFYYPYQALSQNTLESGIVGEWRLPSTTVYLLLHGNTPDSIAPVIIYRSNSGWKEYLSACDKAEQAQKRAMEKKIKSDF